MEEEEKEAKEEKEEKEKAMNILHTKGKATTILDKVEGGWLDWLLPLELLDREWCEGEGERRF